MEENFVIAIEKAEYLSGYKIRLIFSDDKTQIVDFENFIVNSSNPHIRKYQNLELFQQFAITEGDLEWNDYDLCFPIIDLYKNQNISNSTKNANEAA